MSFIDTFASLPLTRAIGWTLLHFVWQGCLIAATSGVALALLRGKSARARYVVCCAGMALMLLAPLATVATLMTTGGAPRVLEISAAFTGSAALAGWRRLSPLLPWIVLVWLVGFAVLQCRTLVYWTRAQRMKRLHIRPLPPHWQRTVSRLCDRIGVRQAVRVVESTLADVPMLIGWLSPVILVPTSALCGLTPQQLRAVLAHELAHVRRHDALVNLVQAALESLLFFHPAVWWISDRMRAEREYCCDDIAVEVCGDTLCYARALSTLENMRGVPRTAVAANGGSLMSRILRLVGSHPAAARPVRGYNLSSLLLAISFAVVFAAAGITMAGNSGTSAVPEPETEPTSETKQQKATEPSPANGEEPTEKAGLRDEIANREAALKRLQRELEDRRTAADAGESTARLERQVYEEQMARARDQARARLDRERLLDGDRSEAAEYAAQVEFEQALESRRTALEREHEALRDLELSLQSQERNEREALRDMELSLQTEQRNEREALRDLELALAAQQGQAQLDHDAQLEMERAMQLQERSQVDADNLRKELDRMRAAEEREAREYGRNSLRDDETPESEKEYKRQLAARDKVIADLNLQLAELQELVLLRKLRKLKAGQQYLDGSKAMDKLERKQLKLEAAREKARIKQLKEEAKRNKKREPES